MLESWLRILQELPLSKSEKELTARFAVDPEGRGFLSIAEVLKTHQAHEESLELLSEGIARHPDYSVARVVLARELYNRGLIQQSLKTLDEAPKPLKDNLLAQKIRFKALILLNQGDASRAIHLQLKTSPHMDEETKDLLRSFETLGPAIVRDQILKDFASKGFPLDLDQTGLDDTIDQSLPLGQTHPNHTNPLGDLNQFSSTEMGHDKTNLISAFFNAEDILEDQNILGFQVIPLYEIFHPDQSTHLPTSAVAHQLDSATLADIYTKQGLFTKALEVYKRLLRVTPGNDFIKRRIAELSRLEQGQKSEDLTIDPEVVDRMEALSVIDKKVEFYEGLLHKIDLSQ